MTFFESSFHAIFCLSMALSENRRTTFRVSLVPLGGRKKPGRPNGLPK
jgi:hypothetical protein